ncbi:uncharacterized protein BO97DRAFT_284351 [Aspergillus homomorphus CBS 101889]|uniref:Uncharacterized protein n=1 Tax=Aspergillus homomorphus (strain CBS 101889) TaxID=1450537 RepID=A0A395I3R8_ASPHC|nr:hypothetical protein BO97DRAFT_284351 [Aspergillus homomorphus CBS 101889]RAL14395.1 hypothetical protein BO97DRAFT_284351 [Aspergillus homomorphus CBS 101889]
MEIEEIGHLSACGCQMVITWHNVRAVRFSRLDSEESYFPLIARKHNLSIYGLAPDSVRPALGNTPGSTSDIPFDATADGVLYSDDEDNLGNSLTRRNNICSSCSQREHASSNASSGSDTIAGHGRPMSSLPVSPQQMRVTKERQYEHEQKVLWESWIKDNFEMQFSKLIPQRELPPPGTSSIHNWSYFCQRLSHEFVKEEYVHLTLKPPTG